MKTITQFCARLNNVDHTVEYHAGKTLLECIIDAELDPTFMCRKGLCGSCMAIRRSGKIEMRQNKALTESDLKKGYVLLCQSIPLSSDVSVDCDG
ncbi:MAG: 2Fe-2S iron-sulfur cluster binding domain-containing protein [Pseudomonadota bacterium]